MSDEPDRLVVAVANALCTTCADHCWDRLPAVVEAVRAELRAGVWRAVEPSRWQRFVGWLRHQPPSIRWERVGGYLRWEHGADG